MLNKLKFILYGDNVYLNLVKYKIKVSNIKIIKKI